MGPEDILDVVYACLPESPFPDLDPDFNKPSSSSSSDGGDGGGEDHISALPDDLLRNIVSRLRVRDAGRAAAVSPRWRGIWRSTPLSLEDRHLIRQVDLEADDIDWSYLAASVTRVLVSHPGPVRRLFLTWNYMDSQEEALAEWLRLLAAKGVENLVLVNRPGPLHVPLPESILRCSSLRRLYLGVWRFPDTSRLTVPPRGPGVFPHLQELGICHAIMNETDFEYLLACCPELKILAIIVSYGFPPRYQISGHSLCCTLVWISMAQELAIVHAPRLHRLVISNLRPGFGGQTVKVKIGNAPQLTVLGYLETATHVLEIGNTIITAGVTNVRSNAMVPSVKVLALKVNFGVAKEMKTMLSFLRCFPQVETLHVMMIPFYNYNYEENEEGKPDDNPTATAESSVDLDPKFWQEVAPIKCVEAHLKKVVLDRFSAGEELSAGVNELEFLKFILERAQMLQNVVLLMGGVKDSATAAATIGKLQSLASTAKLAAEQCAVEILPRPRCPGWSYQRASDLSESDPFPC